MDYTVHRIHQATILEWVAFPFSRGSSQHKDQTQVSRIIGGFFTSWATREAQVFFFFPTYEKNISGILVGIMVKLRIALSVWIIFLKY